MNNKDLSALILVLRKHGIKTYKTTDLELTFDASLMPLPKQSKAVEQAEADAAKQYSEEDALFWSSAGIE